MQSARFAQGALRQERTLGNEHYAAFGRQPHPPAAPGPEPADHLEQASRHRRVTLDQHPFASANVSVEVIEQNVPRGFGDAQILDHQAGAFRPTHDDSLAAWCLNVLIQLPHTLVE